MLKKKQSEAGAPAWVLTYGDMMSLLLCFFILLAAFADYQAGGGQDSVALAIESIRQALGITETPTQATPASDFRALLRKIQAISKREAVRDRGDSDEEGIYGRHFRVKRIRDGMEITIGGPIVFEPFSAELTEAGRQSLDQVAEALKGHRNKIEIRGHAAEAPCPADWTDKDAIELSFKRARAVGDELVSRGVDPRSLTWVAVGDHEPVARGVYDPDQRAQNRRVEIIVRESLIDDYLGQQPAVRSTVAPPASSTVPPNAQSEPGPSAPSSATLTAP